MGKESTIASNVLKVVKIILMTIILILYRFGNNRDFLGVGGTFNLNEDKSVDVEILASGVFVGFFVYNLSVLTTYILFGEKLINECIMNIIGVFVWIAVGGTALHFWDSYAQQHQFDVTGNERSAGLALGSLCLINAFVHIADVVLGVRRYFSKMN